jgi:hypothetical protein
MRSRPLRKPRHRCRNKAKQRKRAANRTPRAGSHELRQVDWMVNLVPAAPSVPAMIEHRAVRGGGLTPCAGSCAARVQPGCGPISSQRRRSSSCCPWQPKRYGAQVLFKERGCGDPWWIAGHGTLTQDDSEMLEPDTSKRMTTRSGLGCSTGLNPSRANTPSRPTRASPAVILPAPPRTPGRAGRVHDLTPDRRLVGRDATQQPVDIFG